VTHEISHRLYRQIIHLYPEPFRREFAEEMLSVFDQCQATQKNSHLLADALIAALRHQLHYLSTPVPARTELYSEVPSSPGLARNLALAVVALAIFTGLFARQDKPRIQTWATVRIEHRIWYLQRCDVATTRKPFRSTSRKDE
jgi:hypothetical protein